MKKITETVFMGVVLVALGMNLPSKAYTDKCRGCWSDCFNPLLHGRADIGGDRNCSHCDALCQMPPITCGVFSRIPACQ